jgi:hypothetical protein
MNSLGARVSAAAAATLVIAGPICRAQSIEAHEVGTGTGQVSHWETSWGSYNRDFHETKNIRIFVRDVSRSLKNVEVHIYFTALKSGGERFIYNHATLQVPLNGQVEVSDEIAAPPLFSHELNLALAQRHYSSGAHMEGWIAIGRDDSRVFGMAASNQSLLRAAQDGSLDLLIAKAKIHEKKPAVSSASPIAKTASPANLLTSSRPPSASPNPVEQFITVTAPFEVVIQYGKTVIPTGTRLKLISREGVKLTAVYMNETVVIPTSATDLQGSTP